MSLDEFEAALQAFRTVLRAAAPNLSVEDVRGMNNAIQQIAVPQESAAVLRARGDLHLAVEALIRAIIRHGGSAEEEVLTVGDTYLRFAVRCYATLSDDEIVRRVRDGARRAISDNYGDGEELP